MQALTPVEALTPEDWKEVEDRIRRQQMENMLEVLIFRSPCWPQYELRRSEARIDLNRDDAASTFYVVVVLIVVVVVVVVVIIVAVVVVVVVVVLA